MLKTEAQINRIQFASDLVFTLTGTSDEGRHEDILLIISKRFKSLHTPSSSIIIYLKSRVHGC